MLLFDSLNLCGVGFNAPRDAPGVGGRALAAAIAVSEVSLISVGKEALASRLRVSNRRDWMFPASYAAVAAFFRLLLRFIIRSF